MIDDLKYFLIIIFNFVFAFGIALQAILYPKKSFSFKIFLEIFGTSYWSIFGEISLLDELDKCLDDDVSDTSLCLNQTPIVFSFLLLMTYMIVSSVLLINLLIAMFSSTFEHIQKNSDKIWKNQRYALICEYMEYPIIPPIIIFLFYIKLVIQKKYLEDNSNGGTEQKSKFFFFSNFHL